MYKLLKDYAEGANFSIVLPGVCNAKCFFCFWERSQAESPMFLTQLNWYLDFLKGKITQVSITGGEPTLSPMFGGVMGALLGRGLKVVLTSNGCDLRGKLPVMEGVVNHINISRHKLSYEDNIELFGTDTIPSDEELEGICEIANGMNIDVTINKVVREDCNNYEDLFDMISFVKKIGASALAIRKDYSTNSLGPIPLESTLGYSGKSRSCPVCVTNSYIVSGVPVHFKYSLQEPSESLGYIYEFVYHPEGTLTEDWKGEKKIHIESFKPLKHVESEHPSPFRARPRKKFVGCGGQSGC